MNFWNHRVCSYVSGRGTEFETTLYEIREVYYDSDGNITGFTEGAVSPCSESVNGLRSTLVKMSVCLSHPVLDLDTIQLQPFNTQ